MTDIIVITSVIEVTSTPLLINGLKDFPLKRSIYSSKERFEQTIETIDSIRKHMPNTDILIMECSPNSEWMDLLKEKSNYFINLYPNECIMNNTNKGFGEATLLLEACKFLKSISYKYKNIYKITGRYVLQPPFNKSYWEEDNSMFMIACKTSQYGEAECIHTFFYKIPFCKLSYFEETLQKIFILKYPGSIEVSLPYLYGYSNIINIEKIGILCRFASYTNTIEY